MSEEQPLLAHDPESSHNKAAKPSWKARTAHFLEHPILHKSVIALVSPLYTYNTVEIQNWYYVIYILHTLDYHWCNMRSSRSCLYLSYSGLSCSRESWMAWSSCSPLPCHHYRLLDRNSVIIMGLGNSIHESFRIKPTCITPCIWCYSYRDDFHPWSCSPRQRERTCRLAYYPTSLASCEIGRRCVENFCTTFLKTKKKSILLSRGCRWCWGNRRGNYRASRRHSARTWEGKSWIGSRTRRKQEA